MKPRAFSSFYSAGFALLLAGCGAGSYGPGLGSYAYSNRGGAEVVCVGPGSITGKVIDATTIIIPHFSAYNCGSHNPVPVVVQFENSSVAMKIGDTVTLKGRLVEEQNEHRDIYGFVLKNAELAK